MTLRDLQMGESAVITTVGGRGALRQHFLDMGMIPGVQVTLVKFRRQEPNMRPLRREKVED